MKNKKNQTTKLITRIIAIILVAMLIFGMIIPPVAAETVGDDENSTMESGLVEQTHTTLPPGFEYVQNGDKQEIVKTEDNTSPAMKLDIPEGFDAESIVVYLGNVETHEVFYVQLYRIFNYVYTLNVPSGYYVVLDNNLIWCDSAKREYTIQGTSYRYIYIGDEYNENLYSEKFETTDGIFDIQLHDSTKTGNKVEHNVTFIPDVGVKIPTNAYPLKNDNIENTNGEIKDNTNESPSSESNENKEDTDQGPLNILWSIVKNSMTFIIVIFACGVIYMVLKYKKQKEIEKQLNQDNDDGGSFK